MTKTFLMAVWLVLIGFGGTAAAQDAANGFPSRPVRFIVPFSAGGGTDIVARAIAQKLSEKWGQTVLVENRAGATGSIGLNAARQAVPDGHTIVLISASITVNPALDPKLPYDLVRDFSPVTQLTSQPYIFAVHPSVPARSVSELIALSRQKAAVNFGSSGTGGLSHLAGAMLNLLGDARMVHIPYKGGGPLLSDLLAGHIHAGFPTPLEGLSHIKTGRLRPLAATTTKRMDVLPEVPTMAEAGVAGYEVNGWYGVLAPAGTPDAVLNKLNESIVEALRAPEVIATFARDGVMTVGSTRNEFGAHVRGEIEKWKKIVSEAGIRKD